MKNAPFPLLVTLLLTSGGGTFGQAPAASSSPSPEKVTVTGSFRTRQEMWSFFRGEGDPSYSFSGNLFRIAIGHSGKQTDWQVEFAAPFLLGLPDRSIAPAPQLQLGLGGNYYAANKNSVNAGMAFPKQAWVRWKGLFGSDRQSLLVGRFEFNDASEFTPRNATLAFLRRDRLMQRLIGSFGWTHVGRSFDGIHYTANGKKVQWTFVGAMPTRGVFQVDGWGNLNTAFGYLAANGQFGPAKHANDWRAFAIYYHDWRRVLKTDSRPLAVRQQDFANIRVGSFGGHFMHVSETGAGDVDFTLWGVAQTGAWGSIDHRGYAGLVEAGWQPKVLPRLKPWLRASYFHGSGDDDPLDGKHNTFFQILPTPRPYARFPFYDMVNNDDLNAILILKPHKTVTFRTEAHALRLASRRDLWYLGGGAFQPWTFGYIGRNTSGERSLANLYDVSLDWNPNPVWAITGYFGYADGKGAMRRIYPKGPDGRFGYLELTYKF